MRSKLPVMLLKGLVMLPTQEVKVELNNDISKSIVSLATNEYDKQILIVCPKDALEENPDVSDLPVVGVIGKIKSRMELPNGNLRIIIHGLERVKVEKYINNLESEAILEAHVRKIILPKFEPIEEMAVKNKLMEVLNKYISASPFISNSVLHGLDGVDDLYKITDIVALFIPFSVDRKLMYMQEINALKRAERLILDLAIETEMLALDLKIDETLRIELENNQREFILREKIRLIKKELGE